MLSDCRFIITCEHASAAIPPAWRELLAPFGETCEEHERWDPGTSEIATQLGKLLHAPVFKGEWSRLLVDLNRSARHPALFSPPLRELQDYQRTRILTGYYYPFRHQVVRALDYLVSESSPVIHLSIHSFTPVFKGERREADFGLLFNPYRVCEREMAALWLHHLKQSRPERVCRANYPYLGVSDGHVTALRIGFGRHGYLGLELEFSQKLPLAEKAESYARWIFQTLRRTLNSNRMASLLAAA